MAPKHRARSNHETIDIIDLTGDDPVGTSSQVYAATPSQVDRDSWLEQDENDAGEIVISTQDGDDSVTATYQLYSVLHTKIVGVQYYRGYASVGEHVIVRREASNPYDSNALRVENVQREQIGHIPRTMAAKLARYMDSGVLVVEGTLAGRVGAYDCPIALRLFGTSEPVERANLRSQMKADRLPTEVIDSREKEVKKRKAEELTRAAAAKKVKGSKSGGGQQWGQSSQMSYAGTLSQGDGNATESFEDLIETSQRFNPREVGSVAEKFGMGEDILAQMPMAECPTKLSTQLLPYQRQALAWLLDKENPQLPAEGSDDAVQLWKRSKLNKNIYTNIATNYSIKDAKPVLMSGGILSDDMGLGKTLEMISLIVADPKAPKDCKKATLIIAPVGVMSNWSGQIAHHVHENHALKVLVYHGSGKKSMKAEELASYDVVITSYGTLATEYYPKGKKNVPSVPRANGLFSLKWRRVILDEGHTIRNPQTKAALAATNLLAHSRWVLTGTPIINNLRDLYSLVRFIGLTGGLEQLQIFNSVLVRPLKAGDENASLLLQALMATICLRRKKEMKFVDLRLPKLSEYVHRIDFLPHEKEKYDALQAEAKGLLRTVRKQTGGGGQDNYRHLLEVLLRLRQVCNHWKLCGERVTALLDQLASQKTVDLTDENRLALQQMLQLSIETRDDCPVCLDLLHDPVITTCAHAFGATCIETVIETQQKCPMCRAPLPDTDHLVRPAVSLGESAAEAETSPDSETTSSKTEALLSILHASHAKDPTTKTVIFSQWTSFLNIIQHQLTQHGYTYARIDGSMRPPDRDTALHSLETNPKCTIMLASLAVCSVGLNLVAANQVILADSWWAPAIEDQAVDRVHRLGQKRDTTVWRLVVEGTVEETVLDVQGEKRKLMGAAFREVPGGGEGRGGRGRGSVSRLGDIERLLR